jgi:hypothetical protein
MRNAARSAGMILLLVVFGGWALALAINLFGLAGLLLNFSYWTGGTHHEPWQTALVVFAVLGCVPWVVVGAIGVTRGAGRLAVLVLLVAALGAAVNAVPYLIHVAEVQITSRGFAQSRYDTDELYDLVLVNRTSAPVSVCAGRHGDCDGSDPPALASGGVVLRPGASRRIDTPSGTHRLTIADASDLARPNATVKVNPAPSS